MNPIESSAANDKGKTPCKTHGEGLKINTIPNTKDILHSSRFYPDPRFRWDSSTARVSRKSILTYKIKD